jgi:hypothetical protein
MNGDMTQQHGRNPELEALTALVGTWAIEATHPAYPAVVVAGRASFEWLEGERFLIQRTRADHPDFPDSISIIGAADGRLFMHYFDSRGVQRRYELSLSDSVWRIWRDAPGFSQRFTGTFGDDGNTIAGLWRLSRDGQIWDDDLEITFRRHR